MVIFKRAQFCVILVLFTYLSLTSHPERFVETVNDKAYHLAGYFVLFISASCGYSFYKAHLAKITGLLFYSFVIEVVQHYIPNRGFSVLDIVANGAGLFSGWILVVIYSRIAVRPKTKYQRAAIKE